MWPELDPQITLSKYAESRFLSANRAQRVLVGCALDALLKYWRSGKELSSLYLEDELFPEDKGQNRISAFGVNIVFRVKEDVKIYVVFIGFDPAPRPPRSPQRMTSAGESDQEMTAMYAAQLDDANADSRSIDAGVRCIGSKIQYCEIVNIGPVYNGIIISGAAGLIRSKMPKELNLAGIFRKVGAKTDGSYSQRATIRASMLKDVIKTVTPYAGRRDNVGVYNI